MKSESQETVQLITQSALLKNTALRVPTTLNVLHTSSYNNYILTTNTEVIDTILKSSGYPLLTSKLSRCVC